MKIKYALLYSLFLTAIDLNINVGDIVTFREYKKYWCFD